MIRLTDTNLLKAQGYGTDLFSQSARNKIREACGCPSAEVHFLVGGTQTNATVIDAVLKSYQGVIAANSGHISVHEAGAIEFGGHKVLTLPQKLGKITATDIQTLLSDYRNDANHDHTVMPGMVYLSHPTEYGTLYTREELRLISKVCRKNGIPLYLDGARLAYALACPENDITLQDLAELCDVFYIGGTKCGALFGEAVVIPRKNFIPHFFTIMKQHGALLAKGRLLGIQFDTLFTNDLYLHIGKPAIVTAEQIRCALMGHGYQPYFESPTNQVFVVLENTRMTELAEKVEFSFWEKYDDTHTVVRFATSWATNEADVEELLKILAE
ncbi:threonine aldolase family protein [Clostridium sp. WILCCON 0269]|uniref:Threonine aldolase family protein n=1 Tax=Candidatus Clostridium eludens TaxID=3381663 RepID=A0ABW8SPW5_9CLOT